MRRARIALVCAGVGVVNRGFERLTRDLFALLSPEFDVVLFKGGGPPGTREVPLRVPRRDGPLRRAAGPARALELELALFAARLLPHLRRGRFDLVHYVEPYLGNVLVRARRRLGGRYRLLLTDGLGMSAEGSRRADYVHVLTPMARDAVLAGRPQREVFFIPAGVATGTFRPAVGKEEARRRLALPEAGRILLDVAALNRTHKRIDVLIREVAAMDGDDVLAVDGALEDAELPGLGRARLGDRFRYSHVPTASVPLLYAAADVFVHAALAEGYGLAVVEAMAAGLPVVLHDAPHFRWLVGDPRQLVDFTRPGALRLGLESLPDDAAARNRARADELDWTRLKPAYVDMLDAVLEAR
jgi:glycosyltransferase involved in cell wall biosynthesis